MAVYRTKGIIIKKIDYSEADRILTIFTAGSGKIRAIAKGVRRTTSKMGGHLEIFNVVDLMLAEGRNFETITSVKTINNFFNICSNLNKTCKAYFLIEILDKLTPDEYKDTRVFNLCVETLEWLNSFEDNNIIPENLIIQASKLKLLRLLGFSPRMDKCLQCNRDVKENSEYYFSNLLGGVVCSSCRLHDRTSSLLNAGQFKIARVLDNNNFDFISRLNIKISDINYLSMILDNYIKSVIEKEIASLSFMRQVDNLK